MPIFKKHFPECVCALSVLVMLLGTKLRVQLMDRTGLIQLALSMTVFSLLCSAGARKVQQLQEPRMREAFSAIILLGGLNALRGIFALICVLLALVVWR